MFPNISLFDTLEATVASGQGDGSPESGLDVGLTVGISVPSCLCLITILILIKQNLAYLVELAGRLSHLGHLVRELFDRIRDLIRNRPEVVDAELPSVVVAVPRNLTDSEVIAMRCSRPGEQWI